MMFASIARATDFLHISDNVTMTTFHVMWKGLAFKELSNKFVDKHIVARLIRRNLLRKEGTRFIVQHLDSEFVQQLLLLAKEYASELIRLKHFLFVGLDIDAQIIPQDPLVQFNNMIQEAIQILTHHAHARTHTHTHTHTPRRDDLSFKTRACEHVFSFTRDKALLEPMHMKIACFMLVAVLHHVDQFVPPPSPSINTSELFDELCLCFWGVKLSHTTIHKQVLGLLIRGGLASTVPPRVMDNRLERLLPLIDAYGEELKRVNHSKFLPLPATPKNHLDNHCLLDLIVYSVTEFLCIESYPSYTQLEL